MILIAPDKFKNTISAADAAEIIYKGLQDAGISDEAILLPMSDGGEGLPQNIGGIPAVASSQFIGWRNHSLAALSVMQRTSYPLGEYLMHRYGPTANPDKMPVYVGIGGTITTDGGAGLLQALGVRFYICCDICESPTPDLLPQITHADTSALCKEHWRDVIRTLCDVQATLCDPPLSALDFAAQKGATSADMDIIRQGLQNLQRIFGTTATAVDGAGGGTGFALCSVIGAGWRSGAEAILENADIPWERISLVVTGEGRIDSQTAGGKVVETLHREAAKRGIPFVAIGGYVMPELRSDCVISTIDCPEQFSAHKAEERLREASTKFKFSKLLKS